MIKLSIDLAIAVNKFLVSRYFRCPGMKIYDPKFTEFSEYELSEVSELTITNGYDISELIHMPNLRVLHIKSVDYNKIAPSLDYQESTVINHISDFSVIGNLANLEELVIANDLYVEALDLSNLKKLSRLILVNNPSLRCIVGLDELKNLNEVTMYGNNIDGTGFDFDGYAKNTRLCVENSLDISMYTGIISNEREMSKHLEEKEITGEAYVRFAEKSGFLNCVCLSLRDLHELYTGLDIYFKKYGVYDYSIEEKIEFVTRYIINNTRFSEELIVDRNIAYKEDKAQYDEIPDKIRKVFNNFHSSFYAYRFKKANCEGRVNLMVFMFKMLGVEAYNVHCHDNRSTIQGSNHSVVRVFVNGEYRYIDPSLRFNIKRKSELNNIISYDSEYNRDISIPLYCVDFDTMSHFVTLDSYEKSLSSKGKINTIE